MSKRPEASVLRLLDEGIALQGIVADTGWSGDEIKALAQQHGFGFNVASMRFQRVPQPREVAGVPRPSAAPKVAILDLIAEGKRSTNKRAQRAADRAEAAVAELVDVLRETRVDEAKAARVRELEEQLRLARADLKAGRLATTAQIRRWALEQGMDVGRNGSLPSHVVDRYHAAHQEAS